MADQPRQTDLTRRDFLGKVATGAAVAGGLGLLGPQPTRAATVRRSAAPVTLTLAMYAEPSRTAIQKAMIAAFQRKYPHIHLNTFSTDFTTFYTKMNTNIAAGTVPDVFMMSGAYFYNAAMKGVLMELDPYIKAAHMDLARDYFTEPANQMYQGKTYGIPGEIDIVALAYNKDLFDAAGVRYPTTTWTWHDLMNAALNSPARIRTASRTMGSIRSTAARNSGATSSRRMGAGS